MNKSIRNSTAAGIALAITMVCASASENMTVVSQSGEGVVNPPLAPLPQMPVPPDNKTTPEKVELGKMLFFDPRLGGDASISCASCHDQAQGWAWSEDFSRGYPGTVHWRNSQTIVNSQYLQKQFWAGSASSGESQARSAARGGVAGNGESDLMEVRMALIPEYKKRFNEVFGDEWPLIKNAWRAISAFERTLIADNTPLDAFLRGDNSALSPEQKRSLRWDEQDGFLAKSHRYFIPDAELDGQMLDVWTEFLQH